MATWRRKVHLLLREKKNGENLLRWSYHFCSMCFMDKYRKRFHGCAMVRKCLHGKSFLWSKNIKSVSDLFNVVATFRGWIQFRKFVCAKDLFAKPRLHKSIFTDISIYPLPLWLHSRIKLQNFRLPYLWTKVKGK